MIWTGFTPLPGMRKRAVGQTGTGPRCLWISRIRLGEQIVSALKKRYPEQYITAVGTNSLATSAMLKAGADVAATGENPVIVCSRRADVIIGPVGIVIADALLGEITAAMAAAVGQSPAKRILVPVNHCDNYIVGVTDLSMAKLIEGVVTEVGKLIG